MVNLSGCLAKFTIRTFRALRVKPTLLLVKIRPKQLSLCYSQFGGLGQELLMLLLFLQCSLQIYVKVLLNEEKMQSTNKAKKHKAKENINLTSKNSTVLSSFFSIEKLA